MTVSSHIYKITHCIICDENPAAKGVFAQQLNNLDIRYNAKITWKRCRLCKIQDTTMALIEVEREE